MSWDIESRALAPVPRIPSAASGSRLAPRGSLAPFSPAADQVLDELHALLDQAHGAVAALSAGRPGGSAWEAAETAMLKAGKVEPFAKFIAGEPTRYATAVLEARTIVARVDDARRAGQPQLSEAAVAIRAELVELNSTFAIAADAAWTRRGTGAGIMALEDGDRLLAEMSRLSALATWCSGTDREFQHQGRGHLVLDEKAAAAHYCAKVHQGGILPTEMPKSVVRNAPTGFASWVADLERRHILQAG